MKERISWKGILWLLFVTNPFVNPNKPWIWIWIRIHISTFLLLRAKLFQNCFNFGPKDLQIHCFWAHLCVCTVGSYASLSVCMSVTWPKFRLDQKSLDKKSYLQNRLTYSHQILCSDSQWWYPGHIQRSMPLDKGQGRQVRLNQNWDWTKSQVRKYQFCWLCCFVSCI